MATDAFLPFRQSNTHQAKQSRRCGGWYLDFIYKKKQKVSGSIHCVHQPLCADHKPLTTEHVNAHVLESTKKLCGDLFRDGKLGESFKLDPVWKKTFKKITKLLAEEDMYDLELPTPLFTSERDKFTELVSERMIQLLFFCCVFNILLPLRTI